jgi:hypothetical protein
VYVNGTNRNLAGGDVQVTIRRYNGSAYPLPAAALTNLNRLRIFRGSNGYKMLGIYLIKNYHKQKYHLYTKAYSLPINTYLHSVRNRHRSYDASRFTCKPSLMKRSSSHENTVCRILFGTPNWVVKTI